MVLYIKWIMNTIQNLSSIKCNSWCTSIWLRIVFLINFTKFFAFLGFWHITIVFSLFTYATKLACIEDESNWTSRNSPLTLTVIRVVDFSWLAKIRASLWYFKVFLIELAVFAGICEAIPFRIERTLLYFLGSGCNFIKTGFLICIPN